MKKLMIFVALTLLTQVTFSQVYSTIENFESGSSTTTVVQSGSGATVSNTTSGTGHGNYIYVVNDDYYNSTYWTSPNPVLTVPASLGTGKTWSNYDGVRLDIYPKKDEPAVGLDLSMLKAYEDAGVVYKDANGNAISDVMKWVVKEKGVNYVRVRLFVDPTTDWAKATAGGTAYASQLGGDLATVKVLGKRIKDAGARFLLDIMYSDGWADPGQYLMPKSWATSINTYAQLNTKMYDYTKDVLQQLKAYGAEPDMVQVGNEITYGMFFTSYDTPLGNFQNGGINTNYNNSKAVKAGIHCHVDIWTTGDWSNDTNWGHFVDALKSAISAVREVCPGAKIILHNERSGATEHWNNTLYTLCPAASWFKHLVTKGVDFDIMGLSYYPEDHGTLSSLNTVLSAMESNVSKPIMLCEYGYSNEYSRSSYSPKTIGYYATYNGTGYDESSPLAQRDFISALISTLKNHNVTGMFYWFADENEGTGVHGPYYSGNASYPGIRNSGLWANRTTTWGSNKTTTMKTCNAGCALPALDVLADFKSTSKVSTSTYTGAIQVGFWNGSTFTTMSSTVTKNYSSLNTWYTVDIPFNKTTVASYLSSNSAPTTLAIYHKNNSSSTTPRDFYIDNVQLYATQTYTITWSVNGVETDVEYSDGEALRLPTTPSDCGSGKVFVGWTATAGYEGNTAPSNMFTTASGTVTADKTYYAVYALQSGTGSVTKTITYEAGNPTAGDTVLIVSGTSGSIYVLPASSVSNTGGTITGTALTIPSNGKVADSSVQSGWKWVYDGTNFEYGGQYIGSGSNIWCGSPASGGWYAIYDSSNGVYCPGDGDWTGTYKIYCNSGTFTTGNGVSGRTYTLVRKVTTSTSGTVTYSEYSTDCACSHTVTVKSNNSTQGSAAVE